MLIVAVFIVCDTYLPFHKHTCAFPTHIFAFHKHTFAFRKHTFVFCKHTFVFCNTHVPFINTHLPFINTHSPYKHTCDFHKYTCVFRKHTFVFVHTQHICLRTNAHLPFITHICLFERFHTEYCLERAPSFCTTVWTLLFHKTCGLCSSCAVMCVTT